MAVLSFGGKVGRLAEVEEAVGSTALSENVFRRLQMVLIVYTSMAK